MGVCQGSSKLNPLQWATVIVVVLLTSCSQAEQGEMTAYETVADIPALGDRLIDASIGDATNLIPMLASDSSSSSIAGQLYLSLLKYNKNLEITGQLAESWDISEDNRSITFKLRKGLKWSDGTPFTSIDCEFTLNLIQDDKTQSPHKSEYMLVSGTETPDNSTFIVHYDEAFSPALVSWTGLSILPKHIFEHENIMDTKLSRSPTVTIGPYMLKDWQSQQSITLQSNPEYFDGPVWISERITRIIPDQATQFLELTAGKIDQADLTPMQYTRQFENNSFLKENYNRYKYLGFGYTYLGFNLKRKPFDNKLVREAIAYAIDREEILKGVQFGLGETIASPYKPGTYWVNEKLKPRTFNPEKAKALLAKAGWIDSNKDGILDKNGKPLSFTVLTNNGNKQRAISATVMQQRLRSIGIDIKIRLVEWSAFIQNFVNTRNFDAVILGWSLSPDPDQYNIWHSSQTGPRQFNFLSYNNAKVDAALDTARHTFDRMQRKQQYDIMQQEIYNDVPMVFLFAPYSLPVMHKRFHGVKPAPAGIGYNSEHWYAPAELQKYKTTSIAP